MTLVVLTTHYPYTLVLTYALAGARALQATCRASCEGDSGTPKDVALGGNHISERNNFINVWNFLSTKESHLAERVSNLRVWWGYYAIIVQIFKS